MCEYCQKDGYYERNKSLISKTLKNNVDIDLSINVKDKKLVASIENLTMNPEDNNWILPSKKINFCPMCRKEVGRVNKEEIVQRLKFTSDEINKDIKRFEETHNFEYIYDYNIYSTKEFIDELIDAMEDKQC